MGQIAQNLTCLRKTESLRIRGKSVWLILAKDQNMKGKRYSNEQTTYALKRGESGDRANEVTWRMAF